MIGVPKVAFRDAMAAIDLYRRIFRFRALIFSRKRIHISPE